MKKVLLGIVAIILVATILNCSCSTENSNITATVVITRNLGSEIISPAQEVNLNNGSAMDALKKTAKVETAYGGGFVQAINGIKNTSKEAWFYYINGFLVNVGASAYQLQDGDVEQWDFHPYAGTMFIDALIGHFPQPFLNGYGGKLYPTVIVYQPGFESQAEALKDKLEELGVKDVAIKRSEELSQSEKESYNLILIGTAEHSLISELNSEYQKYKLPVHFESGKLIALTLESGEREFENARVIQAIKNPWNPKWVEGTIAPCENVAWIISGTGELEAEEACDLIINNSESFAYSCAVVIANGTIMRVP